MADRGRHQQGMRYADPLQAGRHPFQTYLLLLCLVTGVPAVAGEPTAGSVDALLPPAMSYAWSCCLVAGSAAALVGTYLPRSRYAAGVQLERTGLYVVGIAALVYGALVAVVLLDVEEGLQGLVAGGIVVAFGFACIRRAADIGGILHRAQQLAEDGGS